MHSQAPLVIDVGMFDGADTEYYLETGHRVIAVEAHPVYAARATERLQQHISSGRLQVLNVAIAASNGPLVLNLDVSNVGGHSILPGVAGESSSTGGLTVEGRRMADILASAPQRPKLIKIDIEGADHLCLQALTADNRPDYLSCEMHDGLRREIAHLEQIGFTRFKLIDQMSFLELSQGYPVIDRIALGAVRRLGYSDPRAVRRAGRWFTAAFSSGPAPWESSGRWHNSNTVIAQFDEFKRSNQRNLWFDLHAC